MLSIFRSLNKRLTLCSLLGLMGIETSFAQKAVSVDTFATGEAMLRAMQADETGFQSFFDLPWDDPTRERRLKWIAEWEAKLQACPFESWDTEGRIDWLLAHDWLVGQREDLVLTERRQKEMEELLPFRQTILDLERRRGLMEVIDPQAAAAQVAAWPEKIKEVRKRLEAGKKEPKAGEKKDDNALSPSPVVARRAAEAITALQAPLKRWAEFYSGYRPDFSWWVKKPYEEATKALEDLAKYLKEDVAGLKGKDEDPLIGDPIGREALLAALRQERIALSPEEMVAIGEREFAWCTDQMKKEAAALGCGDDVAKALEKVKTGHVPPGQQDELVTQIGREATAWVKEQQLVDVPAFCEETWRLTMLTPETQKVLPFAAYGGQAMLVAYPRDDMAHADKLMSMRGNNRHFTRIVTPHELIPGHHLQRFMSQRHRPWRQLFSTPFYVEGWALYWEMLMWDRQWAKSAEDRLGMLFWRRHRCARIVVSLKFHLNQMTPPQMIDFLVKDTGLETSGATSEVRRFIGGSYGPLYQCGYMIGGLQLRTLAQEALKEKGLSLREFHNFVLTQGPIPIDFVRMATLQQKPERDSVPQWRF